MKKNKILTSVIAFSCVLCLGACSEESNEIDDCSSSVSCPVCEESSEGGGLVIDEHEHLYSDSWQADTENSRYHVNTCTICGEILEREYHEADQNGKCIDCGFERLNVAGLTFALNSDNESYYVSKYDMTLSARELFIPSTYEGLPVTTIGASNASTNSAAFLGDATNSSSGGRANYLQFVSLPQSVTMINDYAFYKCYSLREINLSPNIVSIGDYAFEYCASLQYLNLPDCLSSLGGYVFARCYCCESFAIPDGIETIATQTFYYCCSMDYVVLPSSITCIEASAFYECDSLTDVYFKGTQSEWDAIDISSSNRGRLDYARKNYYDEDGSLAASDSENNYWHYDDDGEIVLW